VPTFLKDGVTFVGIVEFDGTLAFKADGSGLDESSWTINMPPVLTGADPTFTSSFSIFDNFSLLVEGLDLFLLNVQDLLDGPRGLGVTLPLGGDELVEAGFFVEPIRAWAVEQLFTLADTLVTSDEAAAFAAINSFLTGTAFNVQVFGETVTVALTPTATDADGDGDFDRLEWDIALSQQDAVVDRVIPLDTLAPALQMEITGFLEVTVDWDFTFTMFLDAIDGFGIELSPAGTPEMHVALDVHLPVDGSGVRITMPDGKIGLFSAIFTDSRNATVITSITAENFLNTAQTLAGNVVFTLGVDKTNDNVVNPINYTVTVSQTDLQEGLSLADTNTSPLEYAINQALKTAKDSSSNTVDLSGDVAAEFVDGRYVLTTNGLTVYNVTISGAGATTLGFADGQQQARLYTYFKPAFTMDLFNAADPTDPELFYGDIDNLTMATTVAATNLSDLPSGVAINRLVGSLVYDFDPAAFTMKLNLTDRAAGAVSEHSLSVQNTSGNTSIADLAQDLRDAITAAGLDGKVTVTVENGKLVLTPDGTLYKHIAVAEKGKALGFSDGQYVHVAPPGAAIAVLALDIDTEGSVAQGFLPGVYSKIDLVYAVTNVPAALITTPDDPGLATGIVSLKFGETLIEVSDLLNGLDQTLEVFEVIFGNPAIETILKMLFEIPGISDLAGAPIGLIDLGFIYATYSAAKDGATSEEIEKIVKRYENAKIFYAFVQSLVQLSRSINVDRSNGFAPFINASEGFDLTFQLSGKDFRLANVPTLYAGNDTSGVFSYSVGSTSSKVDLSKRGELFSGKRQFSDDKVDLAKQFKTPEKPKDGDPPPHA
jgi:NOL1/NOP2/fmu family ribosome biogenesis protein